MTHISDILDVDLLDRHVASGNVDRRHNKDRTLFVYKYSKVLPYRVIKTPSLWDDVTRQCRGLVVDIDGDIVARGFDKFFNYSELPARGISADIDAPGVIMPKADGSLGLCYVYEGKWHVSTSGGFSNDQSAHATKVFRDRYNDTPAIEGLTLLVEIIYPDNRIVTDYGDLDDLILLAGMTADGRYVSVEDIDFAGPKVETRRGTIRDALNTEDPDDTSEGWIVRQDNGLIVKIKYDSYLGLHKLRSLIAKKTIFEHVKNGTVNDYIATLPDEFYADFEVIYNPIREVVDHLSGLIDEGVSSIPTDQIRKEQVKWVNQNYHKSVAGMIITKGIAGKDIEHRFWKAVEQKLKKV